MKHLLIVCLIVGLLDLSGECTLEQKKAFGQFSVRADFLSKKNQPNLYIDTALKLAKDAKALATQFPGKNLIEIKKACDENYTEKTLSYEIIDFITTVVYPSAIKGSFSSSTSENDERAKKAVELLSQMFLMDLFKVESLDMLIDIADRLLYVQRTNEAEYSRLIPIILHYSPAPSSLNSGQQKRIFEKLLLPLFTEHAHEWILYSPNNPYEKLASDLLSFDKNLKTTKTSDGKTLLHHLFEQDLSNAFEIDEFGIQSVNWGGSYGEYLRLPRLSGFHDEQLFRYLSQNTQISPIIIEVASTIKDQKDLKGDTIFHTLRKNNKNVRKDGDMRALIEHWLEKREAEYGAGLIGTFDWYDATNTWYLDYPPYIAKVDREAFLNRYISHALSLLAESINALA